MGRNIDRKIDSQSHHTDCIDGRRKREGGEGERETHTEREREGGGGGGEKCPAINRSL